MTSTAAAARGYAARGLAVLPIREGGKEPLVEHGVHDATTDAETIDRRWSRWPRANVAIAVPREWFVLDVDPRNGGEASLEELEVKHGALPATITQRTGSGGAHLLFARPPNVQLRGKIAPGLDVLAVGRYFVASPSTHPCGGSYRWTSPKGTTIAQPPAWLAGLVVQREVPTRPRVAPLPPAQRDRVERARRYLAKCDGAISGQGGHAATFNVAMKAVRGFALNDESAFSLLCEWNERCEPPWSESDLRRKVTQAARFGRMPHGALLEAR